MLKAPWRILIVAALCVATLLAMVVREAAARVSGYEALLAMEAIDPRSLLQGHYVTITLREAVPPDLSCLTENPEAEWLALAPNGTTIDGVQVHSLFGAAPTREELPGTPGALIVRGGFFCSPPIPADETQAGAPGWQSIELGIDRFHINQRDALRIEAILREQNAGDEARVYAFVSIGRDGRARLKGLMVDGERLELNWL